MTKFQKNATPDDLLRLVGGEVPDEELDQPEDDEDKGGDESP